MPKSPVRRVLIVEDNLALRDMLAEIVTMERRLAVLETFL